MQLYEINQNGNKYCGPSIVSAVAGVGTKEAAAIMRARNFKTAIKGSSEQDVRHALEAFGFGLQTLQYYRKDERMTLRQWAKSKASGKDVYLVTAGHHWILVQGRYAMCGKTINLVPIQDHPHTRCFVTDAFKITKIRAVQPEAVIQSAYRRNPNASPTGQAARRKARALAAKHGITVEREAGMESTGVWPPQDFYPTEEDDPYFDEGHYAGDWIEILERVQTYVKAIEAAAKKE